ncbi:glycosyltransferase family 2 protein [Streptococcus parauberis]|uniref:Glycosyltransferase family 2 protein n=1 Tax=Streptococcus parauberis TaxID=1348 RepID=A0AAE4HTE0_9STRE|nr:glycosyltransferase family 2 protein [Streptococcus parauberis]MDT2730985.1 glycosyltransferase family 2 protein [Streptococcus parauberis]PIO78751.1 Undecaprenyl-phosphate mannosyltransferase [Streptococcus parauberis]POS66520.1 Undecaprenyl-phosphate mannosyltransferase [Streptococcus parauberis]
MKKVILIIPAYNEQGSIKNTVNKIEEFKHNNDLVFQLDYIVINDGSTDNTAKILDKHAINHIDLIQNLGIGGGVQTGYIYALRQGYDVAVQFDGDGQHDIASIESLVVPVLKDEADFVIGSRFIDKSIENFQSTYMRRLGINLISLAIKLVTGKKIHDTTSGYRAGNKKVIAYFASRYPVAYPEPESIVRLLKKGLRVKEMPANMFERLEGVSSIRAFKSVTYMIDVLISIIIAGFMKEKD